MSNFVKKLKETNEDQTPSYHKLFAYLIDNIIVFTIRYFVFLLCYFLWLGQSMQRFYQEIYERFSLQGIFPKDASGKIFQLFMNHPLLWDSIFMLFLLLIVGGLYYSYGLVSKHRATYGMRMMKLILVREDDRKISFMRVVSRYLLGLIPWILYVVVLLIFSTGQFKPALLILLLIYIWHEPQIFTRNKRPLHDIICKTRIMTKKKI